MPSAEPGRQPTLTAISKTANASVLTSVFL
jgi:hypothetical protein